MVSLNLGIFDLFTLFFLIFSLKDCYFVTNWTWLSITVEISWPTTNVLWQNLAIYNQSLVWTERVQVFLTWIIQPTHTVQSPWHLLTSVVIFFLCNITSISFKNKYENKKQCGYGFTKVVKQVCQYVIAELRINGREMSRYKWLSAFLSIKGKQC